MSHKSNYVTQIINANLGPDPEASPRAPERKPSMDRRERASMRYFPDYVFDVPLSASRRCALCRLQNSDPEAFIYVNRAIVCAMPYKDILDYLKQRGVSVTPSMISRHYREHILEFVLQQAFWHTQFTEACKLVGNDQDDNISVVMSRMLSMYVLQALNQFRPEVLSQLEPEKLLRLAISVADLTSRTQSIDAATRLRVLDVQKRLAQAEADTRARFDAAIDALAIEAQDDPDWPKCQEFLRRIVAGMASSAANPPLPADGGETT